MKIILMILFISSVVYAESFPKERRLKKLSMHLRGLPPFPNEYQELAVIEPSEIENYFSDKTAEYLKSEEHLKKMEIRLIQLFRLRLNRIIDGNFYTADNNSLNLLFREIIRNNLSWDTLLTGKKYTISMLSDLDFPNDYGFYGAVLKGMEYPQTHEGILNNTSEVLLGTEEQITQMETVEKLKQIQEEYTFDSEDKRIAGAITTKRFFARYSNTSINKNRRRAAAIFRIFLCDDMQAAITSNKDRSEYLLNFVFPKKLENQTQIQNIANSEAAHGERADCMACHYKLDPMGRVFGGSGNSLAPISFKGDLVYQTKTDKTVSVPVDGLGQLASVLVEQRDYKACQTKHFWDWFIGEDRELSEEAHNQLIEKYESLDGKTNDFIHYLVNRAEFYEKATMRSGGSNE